jgi:hypothetical protein
MQLANIEKLGGLRLFVLFGACGGQLLRMLGNLFVPRGRLRVRRTKTQEASYRNKGQQSPQRLHSGKTSHFTTAFQAPDS